MVHKMIYYKVKVKGVIKFVYEGGDMMAEKAIVYTVPEDVRKQSIETLKVRESTLEYLRKHKFKTIEDVIDKQEKIPKKYRGNIYAYLIFGIED